MPRSTGKKTAKKPRRKAAKKPGASKRPPGRPRTTMTDEAIDQIIKIVGLGMWPDRAAMAVGINASTMRSYRKQNEKFRTLLEKAEARAEGGFHSQMLTHCKKQWTAVAWMLERRWPERWAKAEIRAQLNVVSASSDDIAKAICAFLATAEERHSPDAPDVDGDADES